MNPVTHFVLVHGAWHGSWCWERLVPQLTARGHRATAVDVAWGDGDLAFTDHAQALAAACPDEEFVLVGHSLAACLVPLVPFLRPQATAVVMLCGIVPNLDGHPWDDAPEIGRPGIYTTFEEPDGSTRWPSLPTATAAFYAECSQADAAWAFSMLGALNPRSLWDRPYPLREWPDVSISALAAENDAAVTLAFQKAVVPRRLGIDPVVVPGDHSPFLSHPAHTAVALENVTS